MTLFFYRRTYDDLPVSDRFDSRHAAHRFRFASLIRALPSGVLAPVDLPPCIRQRFRPGTTFPLHGVPFLVLAPQRGTVPRCSRCSCQRGSCASFADHRRLNVSSCRHAFEGIIKSYPICAPTRAGDTCLNVFTCIRPLIVPPNGPNPETSTTLAPHAHSLPQTALAPIAQNILPRRSCHRRENLTSDLWEREETSSPPVTHRAPLVPAKIQNRSAVRPLWDPPGRREQ